jgi:hypothetical protein
MRLQLRKNVARVDLLWWTKRITIAVYENRRIILR